MTREQVEELPQRWEMGQIVQTTRGPINVLRLITDDLDWDVDSEGNAIRVEYYEVWHYGEKKTVETSVGGNAETWLGEWPIDILIN